MKRIHISQRLASSRLAQLYRSVKRTQVETAIPNLSPDPKGFVRKGCPNVVLLWQMAYYSPIRGNP